MNSQLYLDSFDSAIWENEEHIDFLQKNISAIEAVVEKYLDSIKDDFPQLTDHSINHSKMLWNYADIIIGEKRKFINPLEAFVLHISFLIHDSGMCYSILNNKEEIEKDSIYLDRLTKHGETDESKKEALFYTVRQRHGDFALRVATEKLKEDEYLIADTGLREELGEIIGKISKSHTCNISYIEREFSSNYCSPKFPVEWSIDCKKISFVLRTADAAHLDNLRTPKSIKMISEIEGESRDHWTFQKKIGFPVIEDNCLLSYVTNSPFIVKERKAWWFCYEALEVLDAELKRSNEYFNSNGQDGFTAMGVKNITNPLQLGVENIRTDGWKSINTKVKVSNPVHIAADLGGIKLYGNINLALRELMQNSIDAINLYKKHTQHNDNSIGEIRVSIEKDNNGVYLVVSDNGIGMSQTIMTNELLDFGGSYWKSNKFSFDYEGLVSNGFKSIGKFGIGFFSIFMLGKEVAVTSWKYSEGIDKMITLDFYDGLSSNPILRDPNDEEKNRVIDKGTSVSVKLNVDPYAKEGFIGSSQYQENTLFSIVRFLVPSSNVKISTKELDGTSNVIEPSHLSLLSYSELITFIQPSFKSMKEDVINSLKKMKLELIEIVDNNRILGKLVMTPQIGNISLPSSGVVLSNGIRVSGLPYFTGYIITDDIVSIKRDEYTKLISYESMKDWAIKQKHMIEHNGLIEKYDRFYYGLLMTFNLYDDSMPIALKKSDNQCFYLLISEFRQYLKNNNQITFHIESPEHTTRNQSCEGFIEHSPSFDISKIVKDEDLTKTLRYKDLIEKIIKEEWGEFTYNEDSMLDRLRDNPVIDFPYMNIKRYTKKGG